jgi:tRNA nucleotidyltransferase/poly(A) polymerase
MLEINPSIPRTKGAYLVGGSVRDLLLGIIPDDYDIAVIRFPREYALNLASCVSGHVVEMGKKNHALYRVVSENMTFDISAIEGKTIEVDLSRRDFTINAVGYELFSGKIIDLFGGLDDISTKKIRIVSKEVFNNDSVRLIRAYRLSAILGFDIEPETVRSIVNNVKLIKNAPGERVKAEFFKILSCPEALDCIKQMCETGLLYEMFPELVALHGCGQNSYHAFDVMDHTLAAFGMLEKLLKREAAFSSESADFPFPEMTGQRSALLKYSILLHDIGKPVVMTIGDDGNIHFISHEIKGAELAKKISKRLKLSNSEADYADFIIRNHISALNLFNSSGGKMPSRRALIRFFIRCGEYTPDILLHTVADIMGKGIDDERNSHFISFASCLLKEFFSDYPAIKTKPRLITGKDLIREFGLSPSPLFKKILSDIEESGISNEIKDRKEALDLAKRLVKKYSGG